MVTGEWTVVFESYLLSGYEEGVRVVSSSPRFEASVSSKAYGDVEVGNQIWFFME